MVLCEFIVRSKGVSDDCEGNNEGTGDGDGTCDGEVVGNKVVLLLDKSMGSSLVDSI